MAISISLHTEYAKHTKCEHVLGLEIKWRPASGCFLSRCKLLVASDSLLAFHEITGVLSRFMTRHDSTIESHESRLSIRSVKIYRLVSYITLNDNGDVFNLTNTGTNVEHNG